MRNLDGLTALHVAIKEKRPAIAAELVRAGADLEITSYDKQTALHFASGGRREDLEIVKCLLEAGASVDVRDKDSNTPLHLSMLPNPDAASLLLLYGCDINIINKYSDTPLHMGIKALEFALGSLWLELKSPQDWPLQVSCPSAEYITIVVQNIRMLLDADAKIDIKNKQGKTVKTLLQQLKVRVMNGFGNVPGLATEINDLLLSIKEPPLPLKHLCRRVIRDFILKTKSGKYFKDKTDNLPLPNNLIKFVQNQNVLVSTAA